MREKQILIILFILFISVFSNTEAQITEEQAQKDIYFHFHVNQSFMSPELKILADSVYERIFENSDFYILKFDKYLVLPDDLNILCEEDSLYYYQYALGLLYNLGSVNPVATELVIREYDKISDFIGSIYPSIDTPNERAQNQLLYKSFSNISKVQEYIIRTAGANYDTLFISDCLEMIDKIPEFQYTILTYFDSVATNNERVIAKLIELYNNASLEDFYKDDWLKERIERIGGQIDLDAAELLSNLIEYINTQSGQGTIDRQGLANSLIAKLETAQKQLENEKPKQAANALNAFLNELDAQQGKHISEEVYTYLKEKVEGLVLQIE